MLLRCAVSVPGTRMFVVALRKHHENIRLDRTLNINGVSFRPMRLDSDGSVKLHANELENGSNERANNGLPACGASATAIAGFFSLLRNQGWEVINLDGFMRYHGLF